MLNYNLISTCRTKTNEVRAQCGMGGRRPKRELGPSNATSILVQYERLQFYKTLSVVVLAKLQGTGRQMQTRSTRLPETATG